MAAPEKIITLGCMHLVVLDGHVLNPGDNPWEPLERLGTLTVYPRTEDALIAPRAQAADIVLTNKTPLTAETLAELPSLRGICVLATGHDIVDGKAARARGVPVCNVPSYGTECVAQHVFALLLELCHRVGAHDAAVRAGEWVACPDFSFWKAPIRELDGLVLGIIGYGRIGRRVARIALCFGMEVWATSSRSHRAGSEPEPIWKSTEEILAGADVISLHCPLNASTRELINASSLATMKAGALLINTARGALVNEPDLTRALERGVIAGAALDVLTDEPMRADCPLSNAPNCIITPHMAWASVRARKRLMAITATNVRALLDGSPVNVVNG
jgi:glycerate dehydrogenase